MAWVVDIVVRRIHQQPMNGASVMLQGTCSQLNTALRTLNPTTLAFPVGKTSALHTTLVRRCRHPVANVTWHAGHALCFVDIRPQSHPLEQPR